MNGSAQRIGAVIIGDELLSGKRRDQHMAALTGLLHARGLELAWVRLLGDDAELLTRNFRETLASGDIVFSYGGIGATPDDRTRQCVAAAAGLALEAHPRGLEELRARFHGELTAHRIRLVEFPQGAHIIPNPVNRIPGFSLGQHHFVPGFPRMALPMVEWVLDTHYRHLQHPGRVVERNVMVTDCREGQVIDLLEELEQRFAQVRFSCLPDAETREYRLELGVRGPSQPVAAAMVALQAGLKQRGLSFREL